MRAVFGVIGHVDHGKTALVHALTGMATDHLDEEKRRGISIVLGFAYFQLGEVIVDLVDMPGHERFVRTMVSGATGMAAALLVVAANEGIKPQTTEHVDIAALLGVQRLIVVVTKADLVTPAQAVAIGEQAEGLARSSGLDVAGCLTVSAVTGAGIAALREAIAGLAATGAAPDDAGFPYLPIDRAFSVAGHGTVVTGTLRRGSLSVSDEIALVPGDRPIRLRSLQVHGKRLPTAQPHQRVAANLRDVQPNELSRGAALCARGLLPGSQWLSVSLRAVAGADPLPTSSRVMLLIGTAEVEARVRLLDRDALLAGQSAVAQLRCVQPVAAPAREHFVLRRVSPPLTIAGGRVIDPVAARVRRHAPAALAHLTALAAATPAQVIEIASADAGARGVALSRLAQLAGLAPARTAAVCAGAPILLLRHAVAVLPSAFDRVAAALPGLLGEHPKGLGRDQVVALLPWAGAEVVDEALALLVRRGSLAAGGGMLRLHVADQEREQAAEDAAAAGRLAETLRRGGLAPPDPGLLAPGPQGRRLANLLVRRGLAVRAIDRVQKRELLFHVDAVESAKRQLAPLLAEAPGLLVGEAGAALGISRKYCVPLLEHLDAIGFTRRNLDRRMLARGK